MPTYEIGGIPVHFPYEAYSPQLAYMETVIRALQRVGQISFPTHLHSHERLGRKRIVRKSHGHREDPLSPMCHSRLQDGCGSQDAVR